VSDRTATLRAHMLNAASALDRYIAELAYDG
jgi:hypothetical protein